MAIRSKNTFIGTSGWMYKDWGERFYPKDLKKGHLQYLTSVFNTVEVNSSFYHLPRRSTFEKWKAETPANFVFAIKLSRFITHQKRLLEAKEPLENFLANATGLGKKLGIVLVQLPPSFRADLSRLQKFLAQTETLGRRHRIRPLRIAFEPRHPSWFEKEHVAAARKLMKKHKATFVFADSTRYQSYAVTEENITADYIYLRFHGPEAMFASEYKGRRLKPWAEKVKKLRQKKKDLKVFAYFNNDVRGYAPWDALELRKLLTGK